MLNVSKTIGSIDMPAEKARGSESRRFKTTTSREIRTCQFQIGIRVNCQQTSNEPTEI